MRFYAVAEVTVTDPSWLPEYMANVNEMVERYKGRYLARTGEIDMVEGDDTRPQTAVLLEFPSREAAYGFYNSEDYAPLREARKAGSKGKFYLIPAVDGDRPT